MNCKMCKVIKKPGYPIYYEDDKLIMVGEPKKSVYIERRLCLWKKHKKELTANELKYIIDVCNKLKKDLEGVWDTVICLTSYPKHFHVHIGRAK